MIFNQIFNSANERRRPIIGIVPTQMSDQDSLLMPNRYVDAIADAGGAPVVLPLNANPEIYESIFPLMDGFVLSGGQDISPERYGETDPTHKSGDLTPNRDEVEALVLSYAYKYDVPLLGICRGMQMINVFFGGTLYLDLADQFGADDDNDSERDGQNDASCGKLAQVIHKQDEDYSHPTHFVNIVRESKLSNILNTEELATNSMHHQGIRDLSPLLRATAYGPDGLIEAIEVVDRSFIVGVQWHPEFFAGEKSMGCIFNSLIMNAEIAHASGKAGKAAEFNRHEDDDDDELDTWD